MTFIFRLWYKRQAEEHSESETPPSSSPPTYCELPVIEGICIYSSDTRLYDIVGCFVIKAPWPLICGRSKMFYTFFASRQTNTAVTLPPPLAEVIKVICLQSVWFREGILFQFFVTANKKDNKKKPVTKARTTESIDFWMTKPGLSQTFFKCRKD